MKGEENGGGGGQEIDAASRIGNVVKLTAAAQKLRGAALAVDATGGAAAAEL